jgi:hypothetical protein
MVICKYLVVMELVHPDMREVVEYFLCQHFGMVRYSVEGVMLSAVVELDGGWRAIDTDAVAAMWGSGYVKSWKHRLVER